MRIGERIGNAALPGTIIAFRGGLGAGKTTMTKGIALGLGVTEDVTSPTYTIVSEYPGRMPLLHVDAYRLSSGEEFETVGGRDIVDSDGLCVIEWSERIADALPPDVIVVELAVGPGNSRIITIEGAAIEEALA